VSVSVAVLMRVAMPEAMCVRVGVIVILVLM
jgi:hypothetical protein